MVEWNTILDFYPTRTIGNNLMCSFFSTLKFRNIIIIIIESKYSFQIVIIYKSLHQNWFGLYQKMYEFNHSYNETHTNKTKQIISYYHIAGGHRQMPKET